MDKRQCMDLINEVEAHVPVLEWTVAGFHVWPIVRGQMYWRFEDSNADLRPPSGSTRRDALRRRVRSFGAAGRGWARARIRDRSHHARLGRPADVVALGDGVSRVLIDGAWYDRVCDPVLEAAEGLGLSTLHLEANSAYRVPRHRPSHPVQPALDRRWLASRLKRPQPADLPGYGQYAEILGRPDVLTADLDRSFIERTGSAVRSMADWFGRLFEQSRPRLAVVVDYGPPSRAFNLAAHEAGVPTVELQHGVHSELHWAYARWHAVPPQGFDVLPRYFWVWTDREAAEIGRWAQSTGRHTAIVGGNPWLNRWLNDKNDLVRRYCEQVDARLPSQDLPVVLVTLQAGETGDAGLNWIAEAARRTSGTLTWWIRLHPIMAEQEIAKARRVMAGAGIGHDAIAAASELPLPALLHRATVHVTPYSSSISEAAAFGVPTVATHQNAAEIFTHEVDSGILTVATGPAELVEGVSDFGERAVTSRRGDRSRSVRDVLGDLLEA